MISSNVFPDNVQLEPCSENLPENSFLHSETDPDTSSLLPGLEDTDHNDLRHVDFYEDSSMPLIVDLATTGLRRSARLYGKPPNKSTVFHEKQL